MKNRYDYIIERRKDSIKREISSILMENMQYRIFYLRDNDILMPRLRDLSKELEYLIKLEEKYGDK